MEYDEYKRGPARPQERAHLASPAATVRAGEGSTALAVTRVGAGLRATAGRSYSEEPHAPAPLPGLQGSLLHLTWFRRHGEQRAVTSRPRWICSCLYSTEMPATRGSAVHPSRLPPRVHRSLHFAALQGSPRSPSLGRGSCRHVVTPIRDPHPHGARRGLRIRTYIRTGPRVMSAQGTQIPGHSQVKVINNI